MKASCPFSGEIKEHPFPAMARNLMRINSSNWLYFKAKAGHKWAMKYLNPGPMFFGPPVTQRIVKRIVVRGGPAAEIPKRDQCASGRHNKRLTKCYCASIPGGK